MSHNAKRFCSQTAEGAYTTYALHSEVAISEGYAPDC